ncbi:accessory Sec system translocase SecA2 [Peribacillus huizhouensis]|uniref:Protein translocase subunit SecA n=1 Tax=Peribacillus huizhouensis TaxID=1501239 RepID=A0ABR6CP41_9BACI|nr:accessory Sec system translocase SecA2 [Peribacillus huizhouensis]MBA9026709.1 preprotein translocase subunit SecA [Peribacillus huizhouensis]
MLSFLKNTFGDTNQKRLTKYYKMVDEINALEPKYIQYSDEQLKEMTTQFKDDLTNGHTIDDIKLDAFAVVREASKRVLGMRHFDVQMIGGLVLTEGNIAEMATGEGKTLVASLPSYLRALEGKGVHVITVNDYLATRDREKIGQIHEFLGLTVGLNVPNMQPNEKKAAYLADITYGVGTEFGFDYLRDNMAVSIADKSQRPLHYAIIDEVDSVLVDEAKTPLIIAGKSHSNSDLQHIASRLAKRFKKEEDYTFDPETKATSLTDDGIEKVEKAFGIDNLYDLEHQTLFHYVIQAVRAHVMFEKDVDYIIKDGKILLVDIFTGRVMEGRSLSDGLHQAIEAKEGLEITEENKTQASVTIQNYFRMYTKLSGMTGTARTEEKEFQNVYGMDVIQIPTNRDKIRVDHQDVIFKTLDQKYRKVAEEVKRVHATGQPILIGTTSILQSEKVASYLEEENLPFNLLNAKSVEQEVELIAMAGQQGQITIATNMAGRGTDILLGEGVAELGGLHVIGTEKHESRRVDNQLRGRAGRQGDPGSSQFYISLEDDMINRFAAEDLEKLEKKFTSDNTGLITFKKIGEFVDRVQRIVEGSHYSMREYNLKLDDVSNEQRNIIYQLRNRIMEAENIDSQLESHVRNAIQNVIDQFCSEETAPEEWHINELTAKINEFLPGYPITLSDSIQNKKEIEKSIEYNLGTYFASIETTPAFFQTLKIWLLQVIDTEWIQHLENMARLKEGIGLRQYQQEDPLRLYQKEGLELFTYTFNSIEMAMAVKIAHFVQMVNDQVEA